MNTILGQKLSVRETEQLVKKLKAHEQKTDNKNKPKQKENLEFTSLEKRLNSFGLKTKTKATNYHN